MRGLRGLVLCTLVALVAVCAKPSNDYIVNKSSGIGYRVVYESKIWSKAKEVCEGDGGKLAVPKTEEDFRFIQMLVRGMQYPDITGTDFKLLAWLGINNLENYKVWRNVDGEDIQETNFHTWAGHNGDGYSDAPAQPHCVGLDAANPGLRDWWCHRPQPFICQKNV